MGDPGDDRPPRLLPALVLFGVAVVVGLTVLGWVIGAILSIVRLIVIVVVAVLVVWAIASARSDR